MNSQKLDEDENAIRLYILENPKCTENQVAMAMQKEGQCHRLTALKKIDNLKERGIILDIKPKRNSYSCLIVKDENDFKAIDETLSYFKKEIELMKKNRSESLRHFITDALVNQLRVVRIKIRNPRDQQTLTNKILDYLLATRFPDLKFLG